MCRPHWTKAESGRQRWRRPQQPLRQTHHRAAEAFHPVAGSGGRWRAGLAPVRPPSRRKWSEKPKRQQHRHDPAEGFRGSGEAVLRIDRHRVFTPLRSAGMPWLSGNTNSSWCSLTCLRSTRVERCHGQDVGCAVRSLPDWFTLTRRQFTDWKALRERRIAKLES